jgi:inhibitor of cysteine peptidase
MTSRIPVVLAGVALSALLAGCGGGGKPVVLTARDDGRVVDVDAGATVELRLESNPSTGFAWRLDPRRDPNVVRLLSSDFEQPAAADDPVVGRGGTEVWRFKAVASGRTSLALAYVRSWEPEHAEDTFTLTVRVR